MSPSSVPVAVPNYDPTIAATAKVKYRASAATAETTFTDATRTAITIGDPRAATDPAGQLVLVLVLGSSYGTFAVPRAPLGVTVDGNGGDFVTLVGTAAGLTTALDGMTSTSRDGAHYDDEIILSVQRVGDDEPGTIVRTVGVEPMSVTVSLEPPVTGFAEGDEEGDDGIVWTPAAGFAGPAITAESFAKPLPVFPTVNLDSAGSSSISSARVRVVGFVPGRDVLSLADTFDSLDVAWDPARGVLTLTGAADPAVYEQAIHALTFQTTAGAGARTLELTVQDGTGESFAVTFPLTVLAGDRAPVVTPGHLAAAFDSVALAPVPLDAALNLADSDGGTLTGATVRSLTPSAGQLLRFTPVGGITVSFDPETGVLTLTGSASVADYQAALRSVMFDANGSIPSGRVGFVAAVEVQVKAGTTASAAVTYGVCTPSDSDQPLGLDLGDVPTYFALDEDETDLLPGVTVTVPSGSPVLGATVRIAGGYQPGEDVLTADGLPEGVTATFDSATGVLTLSGLASAVDYTAALRAVRYANRAAVRSGADRTFGSGPTVGMRCRVGRSTRVPRRD